MSNDRSTIGLTKKAQETVERLMNTHFFKDQMDIGKLGMSIAINNNVSFDGLGGAKTTTWNVGSFDPDNEVKSILQAFYPESETPYKNLEYLINKGLEIISDQFPEGEIFDLPELLDAYSDKL